MPSWKLLALAATVVCSMLTITAGIIRWSLDSTLSGIDKRFELLERSTDDRIAELRTRLTNLDSTVAMVDVRVKDVDSTIAVAGVESVQVKDDVVEVRSKMEEISSGLDDTSSKIESLKTVLNVAFRHDSDIRILLDDDRLSELLPAEFFGDEPRAGAALPDAETTAKGATRGSGEPPPRKDTIANRCDAEGTSVPGCYKRYLKRYEAYRPTAPED